jgi:hypothetical protein
MLSRKPTTVSWFVTVSLHAMSSRAIDRIESTQHISEIMNANVSRLSIQCFLFVKPSAACVSFPSSWIVEYSTSAVFCLIWAACSEEINGEKVQSEATISARWGKFR